MFSDWEKYFAFSSDIAKKKLAYVPGFVAKVASTFFQLQLSYKSVIFCLTIPNNEWRGHIPLSSESLKPLSVEG